MRPSDIIEEAAEQSGEIAAEIVKAPFKAIGSFIDRLLD